MIMEKKLIHLSQQDLKDMKVSKERVIKTCDKNFFNITHS